MGLSGHASGSAVIGVTIALVALAGVVVLARLFTRLCIVKSPGLDDAFVAAALLFSVATTVTMCLQVHWGMGQHMHTLSLHASIESQKPFYVSIWGYNLVMGRTKFSLLLQYLRLSPRRRFACDWYVLLAVNAVYTAWTTLSAVSARCPIAHFWEMVRGKGGARCLDRSKVWCVLRKLFWVEKGGGVADDRAHRFANAGMNVATDLAIGILPPPVLKNPHLPRRQRIVLMIVFGLGGFTCIVSILRLHSLYTISHARDVTWQNPMCATWGSVEVNTGIMCSCLPTLKAGVSRLFPRLFFSSSTASASSTDTHHTRRRRSTLPKGKPSFDALGRGLSGRNEPTQCSTVGMSQVAMGDFGESGEWERSIQVVTRVEQDVEKLGGGGGKGENERSEAGSQRGLYR